MPSIPAWFSTPDSGGAVRMVPLDLVAANGKFQQQIAEFTDTGTDISLHGVFYVPEGYTSGDTIEIDWTANATTGNVKWQIEVATAGGDDTESVDKATADATQTVIDAAPGAVNRRMTATVNMGAVFAADDLVQIIVTRVGSDTANDTLAASATLLGVRLTYT